MIKNNKYYANINFKKNRKSMNVVFMIGMFMSLVFVALRFPTNANAKSSEFEIEDGVLTHYYGDGGEVTIPDSVTSIGDFTFDSNSTITSVIIPDSVISIGAEAFWNCSNLINIAIPDSITYIGSHAFSLTPWLESQQKENQLVVVNGILVDGHACEGPVITGNDVKSICVQAFDFNTKITKITLANTVTKIETEAFAGCKNLKTVIMKDSVCELGERVFFDCKSLTYVKLSNSLASIPEGTFEKCTKLVNVTIPYSVRKIYNAFDSCSKLGKITISGNVTSIDKAAFDYCNKPIIYGIKDSYAYKYANKQNITFKTISISNKKIYLSVGDVKTLKLNGLAICTWKTSDKSVATVNSNGKVTAVGKGKAVITAYLYKKVYKCEVEVK